MNYQTMKSAQLRNVYENAINKGETGLAENILALLCKAVLAETIDNTAKTAEQLLESYAEGYLAVYETREAIERKRKKYTASRTRTLFKNRGTIGAIVRNIEKSPSLGFKKLQAANLLEYSDEYLVCLFPSLFPAVIYEKCKNILASHTMEMPKPVAL